MKTRAAIRVCDWCSEQYEEHRTLGVKRSVCSRSCQQKQGASKAKRAAKTCRCGERFIPTNGAQKHCSPECRKASYLVEYQCSACGDTFRSDRDTRKYCSPRCANGANAAERAGKVGRFGGGVSVARFPRAAFCVECGSEYEQRSQSHRFCKRGCVNRHRWKKYREETAPRWSIKSKGEEACRVCRRPASHLHHIVPRSKSSLGKRDVENNGLPLCRECHYGWHHRTVTIHADVLSAGEYAKAVELGGIVWVERNYPFALPGEL